TCRAPQSSPATTRSTWRTSIRQGATVSLTAGDEPLGRQSQVTADARSETAGARKAAVLGSPIAHSKSPQLHLAAYRALGLDDWTYDRIECTAEQLPSTVSGFGPEWVGVSVTMPCKFAALHFADERSMRAE